MAEFQQFSERTTRELRDVLEERRQRLSYQKGEAPDVIPHHREIRWVRTTTNAQFPDYPPDTGNQYIRFLVEFGRFVFNDNAVGPASPTFTAYFSKPKLIALSVCGWVQRGSVIRASQHRDKWYLFKECTAFPPPPPPSSSSSSPSSSSPSSSSPSSSPSSTSDNGVPCCYIWSQPAPEDIGTWVPSIDDICAHYCPHLVTCSRPIADGTFHGEIAPGVCGS